MEKLQTIIIVVVVNTLAVVAIYCFGNYINAYYREIQDTKEEMNVAVVDELKTVYDTEDVRILGVLKDTDEYIRYEVFVEDTTKQAIYFKDTLEIKIIE